MQRLGFVSPSVGSSSIAAAEPQTKKSTARFPLATHMNSPLHAARCGQGQQNFLIKISMFPVVVALLLLWRHARAAPRLSCDGQRRPRCLGCAQPAPRLIARSASGVRTRGTLALVRMFMFPPEPTKNGLWRASTAGFIRCNSLRLGMRTSRRDEVQRGENNNNPSYEPPRNSYVGKIYF